jgi:hypothetical protein
MLLAIFIIWFPFSWFLSARILARLFRLDKKINWLLAGFAPLFVLGPVVNIFTAWLKLIDWSIIASFVLSAAILLIIERFLRSEPIEENNSQDSVGSQKTLIWLLPAFVILLANGFYLVFSATTGANLVSPWDVLSPWLLPTVAVLVLMIVYAIYSSRSVFAVLLMIIGFSLLIHSYLLVYGNGFGGDRFRHLGSEQRLIQELEYQPTLLTSNIWYQSLGPIKYPLALTSPAKLSYGLMWSLEVIAAKISGISVFQINRFLLPILWSIFLTGIVFAAAFLLKSDKKFALLTALSSNVFYLWQYYGAQGLPASYGLLWLAFYLLLAINYLKNSDNFKLLLLAAGAVLMYFNYSLAFILAGIIFIAVLILSKKKILFYPFLALSTVGLIGLDYLSSPAFNFSVAKILPSWVFANLIDFQSLNRLVPLIGEWHLIDLLFMLVFIAVLAIMAFKIYRQQDKSWLLLVGLSLVILASYLLSYLFLNGEHSLSRRLTLFAMLPLLFIFTNWLNGIMENRKLVVAGAIVVSILTALTFYSGPALNVSISDSDLAKAEKAWQEIKGSKDYCVKENINVILAMEYVSAKEFQEAINNSNCSVK